MAATGLSAGGCAEGIVWDGVEWEEGPLTAGSVTILLLEGGKNDFLAVGVQEDGECGRGGGEVEKSGGGHAGRESKLGTGRERREGKYLGRATARHCLGGGAEGVGLQGRRMLSVDQSAGRILYLVPRREFPRPPTPNSLQCPHSTMIRAPLSSPSPRSNLDSQSIPPDLFAVRDKECTIAVMSSKPSLAECEENSTPQLSFTLDVITGSLVCRNFTLSVLF